jgi:hypothetical protein
VAKLGSGYIAVLCATSGAFGGCRGGAVAQGYFGQLKPFKIRLIKPGSNRLPAIIVINGFMSSLEANRRQWRNLVSLKYPKHAVYEVEWESKKLKDCFKALSGGVTGMAKYLVSGGPKKVLGRVSLALGVVDLLGNPFHQALVKSQMAGVVLAEALGRTPAHRRYILMGHSLGARVCFYTLMNLAEARRNRKATGRISEAHLFGAAVGLEPKSDWRKASVPVDKLIYNYHSDNDDVLKVGYQGALALASVPVGRFPRTGVEKVHNVDVTDLVTKHDEYVRKAAEFICT